MNRLLPLALVLAFFAWPALADLKPDFVECDAQKAARNAALDASVGVSGGCDAEKVAKKTKEDAKDAVSPDLENRKEKRNRDKHDGHRGKHKD